MTNPLSVSEGYAAWAEIYDDDGNPLIPLEEPAVRELMGGVAGRSVLDLGCGTGRHTLWLVDRGASAVALDATPEMLAKARAKLAGRPVSWVEHDLTTRLPFADASFDAVLMGLVVEHVASLDPVFSEIARVLRPGGRFVLSNLHPDRTASGQQARFIDPQTGERRPSRPD
jgi:malonyl-CoA O-methyltransferase